MKKEKTEVVYYSSLPSGHGHREIKVQIGNKTYKYTTTRLDLTDEARDPDNFEGDDPMAGWNARVGLVESCLILNDVNFSNLRVEYSHRTGNEILVDVEDNEEE